MEAKVEIKCGDCKNFDRRYEWCDKHNKFKTSQVWACEEYDPDKGV